MTSSCNQSGKLENQKKERKKEKRSLYYQFIILETIHASFHWGIIHAIGSPEGNIVFTYPEQHLDVFLRFMFKMSELIFLPSRAIFQQVFLLS